MNRFFKRISGLAMSEEIDAACTETELFINRFSFIIFVSTYFYTCSLFLFGSHVVGRAMIPFLLLYSLVPWLTYNQKFMLARVLIFVSAACQVMLASFLMMKS